MDVIRSDYINFHEIIYSYAANNFQKLKELFQTTVFNVCYLCFVQNLCRTMFISKCRFDNILIGIIRSNYINFYEIM